MAGSTRFLPFVNHTGSLNKSPTNCPQLKYAILRVEQKKNSRHTGYLGSCVCINYTCRDILAIFTRHIRDRVRWKMQYTSSLAEVLMTLHLTCRLRSGKKNGIYKCHAMY